MTKDYSELWALLWECLHIYLTTERALLLLFTLPTMLPCKCIVCMAAGHTRVIKLLGRCGKEVKNDRGGGRWEVTCVSCWSIAVVYMGKMSCLSHQECHQCQVAQSKQPDTGEIRKMKICVFAAVTFRCSLLWMSMQNYFLVDKASPFFISIAFHLGYWSCIDFQVLSMHNCFFPMHSKMFICTQIFFYMHTI